MTMTDADRQWILKAARGDIDTDSALDTVRTLHLRADLLETDPELAKALEDGDQTHPDTDRWYPNNQPPWHPDIDPDPDTTQAFDDLIAEWAPDDPIFIHWPELWADDDHAEWLYDNVFALGRGHAIYAQHKQGKSLFVLWVCAQLATRRTDVDVIYLDYEMTRDDLRERLEDMGYGPDTDLTRLHYALLPSLPPLDTGEGAGALLTLIDTIHNNERTLFVVIDTFGRAAEGEENSNDTAREFYRWSGIALKRRQITYVRLDHAGKDATKGQRGGSAKGDDVDVIWRLTQQDEGGIKLHRDAARMSWVPEEVTFGMIHEPLGFDPGLETWPAKTGEIATQLEQLGVGLDASYNTAKKAGVKGRKTEVLKAMKFRRQEADRLTPLPVDNSGNGAGTTPGTNRLYVSGNRDGNQPEQTPLTSGSAPGNQREPVPAGKVVPGSPPKGEPDQPGSPTDPSETPNTLTRRCRCGAPATDISGLCAGCLTNPGTPHQPLDF